MKKSLIWLLFCAFLFSSCGKEKQYLLIGNYSSHCIQSLLEYAPFHKEFTKENVSSSHIYKWIDQNAAYYHEGKKHTILALLREADVIVLSFGLSDFASAISFQKETNEIDFDEEIFASQLEYFDYYLHHIVEEIRSVNAHANLFLMGTYNPYPTLPSPEEKLIDSAIYQINRCFDDIQESKTRFVSTIGLKQMEDVDEQYAKMIWEYAHG